MASVPFWDVVLSTGVSPACSGPTFAANPWDTVVIAGRQLPGIARAKASPKVKHDKKNGPGKHGANPTLHGYKPEPFSVTVRVWTAPQWTELLKQLRYLWPREKDPGDPAGEASGSGQSSGSSTQTGTTSTGSGTGTAQGSSQTGVWDFYAPNLAAIGITAGSITGVTAPEPVSEERPTDGVKVTFSCLEWVPSTGSKPVQKTPKAAANKAARDTEVDSERPTNAPQPLPSQNANDRRP